MRYDSTIDTTLHINRVHSLLVQCAIILMERGARHDASSSVEISRDRFAMGEQLKKILMNTVREIGWI